MNRFILQLFLLTTVLGVLYSAPTTSTEKETESDHSETPLAAVLSKEDREKITNYSEDHQDHARKSRSPDHNHDHNAEDTDVKKEDKTNPVPIVEGDKQDDHKTLLSEASTNSSTRQKRHSQTQKETRTEKPGGFQDANIPVGIDTSEEDEDQDQGKKHETVQSPIYTGTRVERDTKQDQNLKQDQNPKQDENPKQGQIHKQDQNARQDQDQRQYQNPAIASTKYKRDTKQNQNQNPKEENPRQDQNSRQDQDQRQHQNPAIASTKYKRDTKQDQNQNPKQDQDHRQDQNPKQDQAQRQYQNPAIASTKYKRDTKQDQNLKQDQNSKQDQNPRQDQNPKRSQNPSAIAGARLERDTKANANEKNKSDISVSPISNENPKQAPTEHEKEHKKD